MNHILKNCGLLAYEKLDDNKLQNIFHNISYMHFISTGSHHEKTRISLIVDSLRLALFDMFSWLVVESRISFIPKPLICFIVITCFVFVIYVTIIV